MATVKEPMTGQLPKPARKRKNIKVVINPPSIPTKFQTMHFDDAERKGFTSTAKRFYGVVNDLPGPGYYAKAAEKLDHIFADTSISKRGFGVGFASKHRRFKKPPTDLETDLEVSPAQYKPRMPIYSHSLHDSLSSVFRKPVNGSVLQKYNTATLVRTRAGWKPTPGPGEYQVDHSILDSVSNVASAVFRSRTRRTQERRLPKIVEEKEEEELKDEQDNKPSEKPNGPTSSFVASSREQLNRPVKGPGPTHYHISSTIRPKPKPNSVNHLKLKKGHIARKPTPPEVPLSHQVSVPGSGMTPIAFPTPGRYNISAGGNAIHRSVPATRSVFLSKTSRFKQVGEERPGPGFYHPLPDYRSRSFQLNVDHKWI